MRSSVSRNISRATSAGPSRSQGQDPALVIDDTGLTRRALLAGSVAAATAACALMRPTGLDQDPRRWAPNMVDVLKRYAVNSEAVRARIGRPRTLFYGPTAAETLDIYSTRQTNAPVMIFFHGGAWRVGRARDYGFPAETFVRAGAHFVVPDFASVREVGLDGLVDQVRRAVAWVHRNAATFGGDAHRIHVAGHSSGAHLAGNVLVSDWAAGWPSHELRQGWALRERDVRPSHGATGRTRGPTGARRAERAGAEPRAPCRPPHLPGDRRLRQP